MRVGLRWCSLGSGGQVAFHRQIAFTRIIIEAKHTATYRQFRQFLRYGRQCCARTYANQDPFLRGAAARPVFGICRINLDRAFNRLRVKVAWNKSGANSLYRVRCCLAARYHRREAWFNGVGFQCWPGFFQCFRTTRQVTTRADASD